MQPNDVLEVDTPNLAFTIRQPGDYRIDVDPAGDATTVVTRGGRAEVFGEGAAYAVDARTSYRFYGTGLRDYEALGLPPVDDFDRWAGDRDRRWEGSVSARYVSPDVIGYQDLDDNGTWRTDAQYGNVWVPNRVAAGWSPVSRRPLGMDRPVGLDVGGRRAVGLRRVPLRPLDRPRRHVGLGAGSGTREGDLRAGAGGVRGRQQLPARDFGRQRRRASRGSRSVPATSTGPRTPRAAATSPTSIPATRSSTTPRSRTSTTTRT